MPKSKTNRVVHLTQVKKKGKDHKEDLMKQLEQYVEQFERVYLFDFDQTKSDRIMNLRLRLKGTGRIFAGRNSLVSMTLKSIGSKTNTNYDHFLKHVTGHKGLLFTDISCDKLVQLLDDELPEFREKLLGYVQLPLDDDDDNEQDGMDTDETTTATATGAAKAKAKRLQSKKSKRRSGKGKAGSVREVKFVKI